ncbi:TRIC cation channel family protein [Gordonia sp. (in: high G+C Gram-positive bacteria)]|uniref:trimeric intracellular cation channel family protein n=1 Tax=Gordonia sp. (in: high G+C Gram-positive bacteria) TaxID=84139 RepID=UPI0016A54B66|nr:TRIC cation channel family protein [Gordonia sp. (in: high G+C Gram-positive bacteria)]NLG47038.1 trimeric intracellular cation channel family protein [Gordonia sp. (in: high G+C Gram-positive bacteria)]
MLVSTVSASFDDAASAVNFGGEMLGIVAFAASGALLAVRRDLDIVGIVLLAAATALGGGIIRDVIIGKTPPTAFTDLWLVAAAVVTGLIIFFWQPPVRLTRWPLEITDAVGLGLFAVTGTVIAYDFGLAAPSAAMLGITTGIGGGIVRDVLSGHVPAVLRPGEHLYAIPALGGAAATAVLLQFDLYTAWSGLLCAALVVAVRIASLKFGWHGPRPRSAARGDRT